MAAIYQWFDGVIISQVWTTTLYPIQAIDEVQFNVDLTYGYLQPQHEDDLPEQYVIPVGGEIVTILLDHDIGNEDLPEQYVIPVGGEIITILLEHDIGNEDLPEQYVIPVGGAVDSKLVTALAPEEKVQMTVDLNPSACSMTAA